MKLNGKDSVRSWIIAVACSIIVLLAAWPMRLGGQLFVSLLDHFQTNRKAGSLPFALAFCLRSASGPFSGYFANKFGVQRVIFMGCLLCAIGVGGCYFAENMITVDICLGIIYGIGLGCSTNLSPVVINQHFMKHRAKANGIVFGVSGLGAFVTPPLLDIILKSYGVSGTFMIICAILLNGVPAALLLSSPKQICEKETTVSAVDVKLQTVEANMKPTEIPRLTYYKKQNMEPTIINVNKLHDLPISTNISVGINNKSNVNESLSEHTSLRQQFSILWNPCFLLITLIQSSHFYVMYITWTIIVDVARDKNVKDNQQVYFVMALSISDTIGRFLLGIITDSEYMTKANFCALCFGTMALFCTAMTWVSGFLASITFMCLLGLMCGGNITVLPGIVTEYIQKDQQNIAMPSRIILYAPMSFTMSPLIGYFRENIGSYNGLFYTLTGICAICCGLVLLLPKLANSNRKENDPKFLKS